MNKSEAYFWAIASIINNGAIDIDLKVDILSHIVPDYNTAVWSESREKEVQA